MRGIVVDLETTGLLKDDKIVSITLLEFNDNKIENIFNTFVDPMKPIKFDATKVTGITNEMVKGFPQLYEHRKLILEIINNKFLYAYNSKFEERFLKQENIFVPGIYDILKPCKEHFKLGSYKLCDVASYLGIKAFQPHSSLGDAILCFKILLALNERGHTWQF